MKKHVLFTLILASHFSLLAYSLAPWLTVPAKAHLAEVNAQWECQAELPVENLTFPIAFSTDDARIAFHLQMVVQVLEETNVSHLNAEQLANRTRLTQVLANYAEAGQFPQNKYESRRQPYFVDDHGTHCAVGYLMQKDGAVSAVKMVRDQSNEAYLHDLAKTFPAVPEWAEENGFSLNELALIQPGYSPVGWEWNLLGNGGGYDGEILSMTAGVYDELLVLAGDFSIIDDVEANNIVGWDGENWITFGQGLNGKVHDVVFIETNLILAVGEFTLFDQPNKHNIAMWNGEGWIGLQEGAMNGGIYTMHQNGAYGPIYLGGNFDMLNGDPGYQNLAIMNYGWGSGQWSIHNYGGAFSIDGEVEDITEGYDQILIAGEFSLTGTKSTMAEDMLPVNNLAYWKNYEGIWNNSVTTDLERVTSVDIHDGFLYAGGTDGQLDVLSAGLWHPVEGVHGFYEELYSPVNGFIRFQDAFYAFGKIRYSPLLGDFGSGLIPVYGEYAGGEVIFNDEIKSVAFFQNHLYVAGDFTVADNQEVPGLAARSFLVDDEETPEGVDLVDLWSYGKSVFLNTNQLGKDGEITVYNALGQTILTRKTNAFDQWLEIPVDYTGMVFCEFEADGVKQAKQLVLM